LIKKKAFIEANEMLKRLHRNQLEQAKKETEIEKLDYFPFTHGDLIENQRKVLEELQ